MTAMMVTRQEGPLTRRLPIEGFSAKRKSVFLTLTFLMLISFGCQKTNVGPGGQPVPDHAFIDDPVLSVPIVQLQTNWCWAASAQMVLDWQKRDIIQCKQADYTFGTGKCCQDSPSCNIASFPDKSLFEGKLDYHRTYLKAIPLPTLEEEIAFNKRPVIFSWKYDETKCNGTKECGHMMVAVGYRTAGKQVMIQVLDPWNPAYGGDDLVTEVSYDYFVAEKGRHTHWSDFYAFKDGHGNEY